MRDKTSLSFGKNVKKSYHAFEDSASRDESDGLRDAAAGGTYDAQPTVVSPDYPPLRHIHPCICDLSDEQKNRIREHHGKLLEAQRRYEQRLNEIQAELERQELTRAELENLEAEEQEFYGDEYTFVGTKRKRRKRSARRGSMISLGVRQVINSKKPPLYAVKFNQTSKLREFKRAYCKSEKSPLPPVRPISYEKSPIIPVRSTRLYELRFEESLKHLERLKLLEDSRPRFITAVSN